MPRNHIMGCMMAGVLLLAGANVALASTDVSLYTGVIWGGQSMNVGAISAVLHYTNDNDATVEVKYETSGGWRLTECHLWINTQMPASRGAPGQYPYNSGAINATSYSFNVSIADLRGLFGADWGNTVYVMPHCAVFLDADNDGTLDGGEQTETGYGGDIVKPKRGSWFGFFGFGLTQPAPEPPPPPQTYIGVTIARMDWQKFWNNDPSTWVQYTAEDSIANFPVTLAKEVYLGTVPVLSVFRTSMTGAMWDQFRAQLLATYFNSVRDSRLDGAYYNDPDAAGEFMENEQVSYVMTVANTYSSSTPVTTLAEMTNVLADINNNSSRILGVLWDGPAGRPVPLGPTARLTVSPNPFTSVTRVQYLAGLTAGTRVGVYDRVGNKVNELVGSGTRLVWDGTDARGSKLAAGVYLLKVEGAAQAASARVIIGR